MVVKLNHVQSIARNGYRSFVPHIKKITIQYCNWGGSSKGIRDFLSSKRLDNLIENNKHIEFEIVKKSGHPILRGEYANGREKVICVRNLNIDLVENKFAILRNSTGEQLHSRTKNDNVESLNKSVRGIWSPLHEILKHKV
ncbi:probable 54S ribosomal protein L51, mitochondrial [Saccharomycodes ludwigii]|uniref:Large ribosomal subunit protein mL43 n=1 Tax=Saccharomycodes ludwigii TaxID=36035 RepID=A0A376B9U8_9ASCO|nr:hypothetical protein SCDLUD_000514 [Saccharomycodes ludwigii]KAH3902919.1 hypothetical protein SCDLUD_000514 [Saccharomycodes ludwigii]SSD61446.1 probable 54S ribosomal protein L51, mitochondrial [Saccharomycodes ludwigii]